MPDQVRAALALFIVMIVMFVSLTVGGNGDKEKDPVDEPNYSSLQHSAMMTDDSLDWGISLKAQDVTNTGLTLICGQSGGAFEEGLACGPEYALDKLDGAKWIICDTVIPKGEVAWDQERILIKEDAAIVWNLDWTDIYGELKAGSYRISKTITDGADTNTYFAYFTVE